VFQKRQWYNEHPFEGGASAAGGRHAARQDTQHWRHCWPSRAPRVEFPWDSWHGRTTALEMPGHAGMIGRRCLLRLLSFNTLVSTERAICRRVMWVRPCFDRSFLFWAEPCETISPAQPISQMKPSRISIRLCSQRDSPLPTRSLLRRANSPALCGSGARSGPRAACRPPLRRIVLLRERNGSH
jgi:hypothetical protein